MLMSKQPNIENLLNYLLNTKRNKTVLVNALLNITVECDCWPGNNPVIAPDLGFLGGYNPVTVDKESLIRIGDDIFSRTHPTVPWNRQFEYAKEIGFDK